ncbi:MAG TPA: choice-of-anchor Q domain-containing protein [Dokdonella sp.]
MDPSGFLSLPRRLRLAAAVSLAFASVGAAPAVDGAPAGRGGQVHLVENCNDSGAGSLRAAYGSALDGDIVDLSQLACSTITLASGPIVSAPATGYVTLQGPYESELTISGNHADRVIIHDGARVAVHNLRVVAGVTHSANGGGCIYSTGDVALLDATVTDCETSTSGITKAIGGGVRAHRAVVLRRSRVTGNRAQADGADAEGGGLHALYLLTAFQNMISGNIADTDAGHFARGGGVFAAEYLRLDATTLSGNSASHGAAAYVGSSTQFVTPNLINVTLSGNHASGAGGGLFAADGIELYNSTVTGNSAVFDFGAGVYIAGGDVRLHSTIVAGNSSGDGLNAADIGGHAGAVISGSHNLVVASTLALPADTIAAEPMLAALGDNGGGVLTHALLPGSPAIDAGANPRGEHTDERAFVCPPVGQCAQAARTLGAATDIGAFESGSPDRIFDDGFEGEA